MSINILMNFLNTKIEDNKETFCSLYENEEYFAFIHDFYELIEKYLKENYTFSEYTNDSYTKFYLCFFNMYFTIKLNNNKPFIYIIKKEEFDSSKKYIDVLDVIGNKKRSAHEYLDLLANEFREILEEYIKRGLPTESIVDIINNYNKDEVDDNSTYLYNAIIEEYKLASSDNFKDKQDYFYEKEQEYETLVKIENGEFIDINHTSRILDGQSEQDGHTYRVKKLKKVNENDYKCL